MTLLALTIGAIACQSKPDPRAVAEVAAAAGRHITGATGAPGDSQRVWSVAVATGVSDSAAVVRHLTELLAARPPRASDSLVEHISIDSVGQTAGGLGLELSVSARRRCGPTWETTVAWSGSYIVGAHRVDNRWMLDSAALKLDGAPTICQDSLGRPFPPMAFE
jgi:hypothetical protein